MRVQLPCQCTYGLIPNSGNDLAKRSMLTVVDGLTCNEKIENEIYTHYVSGPTVTSSMFKARIPGMGAEHLFLRPKHSLEKDIVLALWKV